LVEECVVNVFYCQFTVHFIHNVFFPQLSNNFHTTVYIVHVSGAMQLSYILPLIQLLDIFCLCFRNFCSSPFVTLIPHVVMALVFLMAKIVS